MNLIIIHGRLTRDVEERDYTSQKGTNTKMATFSVAVDQRFGDETDFFNCKAFGKTADLIATHFRKGKEILLVGDITSHTVEKDGVKKVYWNVNVDHFDFCGSKTDGKGNLDVTDDMPF